MKNSTHPARRAAWLLLAAPAFLATPAVAQDTVATPPPVVPTVTQSSAPDGNGTPAPTGTTNSASKTVIAPGANDVVDEARVAARSARPASTATPARRVARPAAVNRAPAPARAAAPVAATPAPATVPAPVTTQAPSPAPAAAPEAAAPVPATPAAAPADTAAAPDTATTATNQTETSGGAPIWPLALIVAAIVLVGGFFFLRSRRRDEDVYDEPYVEQTAYAEPERPMTVEPAPAVAAAAPLAAVPVAAKSQHDPVATPTEEVALADAEEEEVAALTDGAPVKNRPWLEFAMRPVRAGTNADEALVEIELTVANSGSVAAQDVRVSTFMLTDANASEMERVLVQPPVDASVQPVTIAPGEGARIDATLAALKADLGESGGFNPVVVADARYRLADGSEGRTSASFVIGLSDEGGMLNPIDLADRVMREDVGAVLHGEPQHA